MNKNMEADTMKRIKEILLIAAILAMPLMARAQSVQIRQPIAAGGGQERLGDVNADVLDAAREVPRKNALPAAAV